VISYILAGLPSDYDSLVTSVTTRLESISLDELHGYLLTQEMRLEQQVTVSSFPMSTANMATRQSSSHNRGYRLPSNNWTRGNPSRGRYRGRGRGRGGSPAQSSFGSNFGGNN